MSVLHGALLAFAGWTLLVLALTIGFYRVSRVLTGRAAANDFPADRPTGPDSYLRAMRAHANCVENLPVFAAIVFVASSAGVRGTLADALAIAVVGGRVAQTTTHVAFVQTARAVSVRFTFFFVQVAAMVGLIVLTVLRVL